MLNKSSFGQVFNVDNPETCIEEHRLAKIIIRLLESRSKIQLSEDSERLVPSLGSIEKIEKVLGWKPTKGKKEFEKALKRYLTSIRCNLQSKTGYSADNEF